MLQSLSIVTITYNNPEDLINTYESLEEFRKSGGVHIIVNGGATIKPLVKNDCVLLEEPDKGIYDALNKGINLAQTPYLMLIHSGDYLVAPLNILEDQLITMNKKRLDLLLNDCTIEFGKGKRLMSSKHWKPWMFKLGAQPPHPPTIYRRLSIERLMYNINHPIIADFDYLERIFRGLPLYDKGNQTLIHMSAGGRTSSGLISFFKVSLEFAKLKGIVIALLFFFIRPLFKLYQMNFSSKNIIKS